MPHKKRRSSSSKSAKEANESQQSQAAPGPAAKASTAKPAQYEKASSASDTASKPGVVTTATGGATAGGVAAGGGASVGTAGKEAPRAKAETNTMLAGATVIDMSSTGATVVDMTSSGVRGGPRATSKTVSSVKPAATAPSPAAGTAAAKPKEAPKDAAKSAAATATVKGEAPKVDAAKASQPAAAAAGGASVQGKKVQVEVPSSAAKTKEAPAADPFDALADILPPSGPAPQPVYTGPEVTESAVTAESGHRCGERDDTLPPGYRWSEMPPAPADVKPKDEPALTTDQAMDSLLDDFAAAAPAKPGKDHVDSVVASSAAPSNFAPAPPKKGVTSVSPAPPADKKAKMEKVPAPSPVEAARSAPSTKSAPAPPADKKPKLEKGDSLPLDALSALGDTLAADEPKPEPPKVRPEDMVPEEKLKKEKGVRVGERDDTLPPEYRFKEDDLNKLPPPKPEPTMETGEALDFLSEGFVNPSSAPAVHAPVAASSAAPAQKATAPADQKAKKDKEAGLTASTAKKVESSAGPPADKKGKAAGGKDTTDSKHKTGQDDSLNLDALSALGDTLPANKPKPESPKLKPKDIVSEEKLKKEKGVRVGERDDTLPPEYRFKEDDLNKLPPPTPEPTMDTGEALDFLSEGFTTSSAAPAVHAPAQSKVEDLSALDALSADFVAPSKAAGVQAEVAPSTKKEPEKTAAGKPKIEKADSLNVDALSALCDTLPEDKPKPEAPKLRPEDIVSEEKLKKEKGVRVGERDDTLPPEYRFKDDLKKLPPPKPEPTMKTDEALDILSEGFSSEPSADQALEALGEDFVAPTAASTVKSAACAPPKTETQLGTGEDSALDALSASLKDLKPAPQPAPVPAKAMVKEKKAVEEKVVKMGERDDSLPPEYRPTEEDRKKMKEEIAKRPKEKSMDEDTALDLLSGDFSDPKPTSPAAAPVAKTTPAAPVQDSDAKKGKSKSKSKSKKHQAEQPPAANLPPAQRSSDVVPASTKKAGKS